MSEQYEHELAEVRKEIKELSELQRETADRLAKRRLDRDRLERLFHEPNTGSTFRGPQDKLAIPATQFRPILQQWCQQFGTGAVVALSRRSNVSVRTIRRNKSSVVGAYGSANKFVSLTIADKLLTAMGYPPDKLNEFTIVGNPLQHDFEKECADDS